jgi:hypothetical protein
MDKLVPDAWFFTHQGERIGPVTFRDLQGRAKVGALNPRQDMVWSPGMAEWKAAGEIEGLFGTITPVAPQKNATPTAPLAPPAEPYIPPREESVAEQMRKEGNWPGARRRSFIVATILFPIAWNALLPVAGNFLTQPLGPEIMTILLIGGAFLPAVVAVYFGLKRLVNLGMSRWWLLAHFVPVLNFWIAYRCFACPPGYAYHKKLDVPGLWLAIFYWLLVVFVVVSSLSFLALFFGAVGDPVIRQQLHDALQQLRETLEIMTEQFVKKP